MIYCFKQRSYEISQDMLKKLYKEKMKQLHPDKHTLKPLQEQEEAGKHASDMTRAYETIKNDYDRALHLLKLEGYPMDENLSVRISNPFLSFFIVVMKFFFANHSSSQRS